MNVEQLTNDEAILGYDYPVEVKAYNAGKQLIPTAATITIKCGDKEASSDVLGLSVFPGTVTTIVDAATMTLDTFGTMTYMVATALLPNLSENYVMQVEYTVGGIKEKATFLFDVVLNALKCSVLDADLKAYSPQISVELWPGDDMPPNYDGQIQEAFKIVKRGIKDKGKRPTMLIDGSQVRELVILKTFEMLCFDFAKAATPTDIWWARYLKYAEMYKAMFACLEIKYDEDQSGTIEMDEKKETLGQIFLQR
jgi:hypothetical protein